MDPLTLILIAAFVAAGVALGWVVGRGRAGAIAEERGKAADELRASLSEVTKERDAAMRDLAGPRRSSPPSSTRSAPNC
jgi:hypothetical protein